MNTIPESANVKLTPEQLEQIETTKLRLATLESEIAIANKSLTETKSLSVRAIKDREYQEELLVATTEKTTEAKALYEDLLAKIEAANNTLSIAISSAKTVGQVNEATKAELEIREAKLQKSESEHIEKIENFNKEFIKLSEEKDTINVSKKAFLQAVESVTWK